MTPIHAARVIPIYGKARHSFISNITLSNYDPQLFTYDNGAKTITWHDSEYVHIITVESAEVDLNAMISIAKSKK